MRRRLPAVFLAALLTFAVSACGDDSEESGESTDTGTTTQTDGGATDDADDTTSDPEGDADDTTNDPDDDTDGPDDAKDDGADKGDEADDNGAIPDDLESDGPDDPDDLPIDAQVVLDTCEDVDPKDTWPSAGQVTFDGGESNVVATAEVSVKGGQPRKIVCDIAGPENNPQVKAYQPIG